MSVQVTEVTIDQGALEALVHSLPGVHGKLVSVATEIVLEAQDLAPVDTGFLRDSIHVEDVSNTEVEVVAGAEYAAYVEFGTRRMAAQPFLRPALDIVAGRLR